MFRVGPEGVCEFWRLPAAQSSGHCPRFSPRLPLCTALVLAAAETTYLVRAAPQACVVLAGARSFNLAELGHGRRGPAAVREPRGGLTPLDLFLRGLRQRGAACAGVAPGSAALQQMAGACYGLSAASKTHVVAVTGQALSFSGEADAYDLTAGWPQHSGRAPLHKHINLDRLMRKGVSSIVSKNSHYLPLLAHFHAHY